jgi:CMP-N-acetylneuraminic acid synthetase
MSNPKVKVLIFMKENSVRVPEKNIRPFCGRPLFHWILKTLQASDYISEIIINTDSDRIAIDAKKNFDVTIHMRPNFLLAIDSNEANQIIDYDLSLTDGEYFLQTHSTNPNLKTDTVNRAIETFFESKEHDSLFSVTPVKKRFYWPDGRPINHDPMSLIKTQDQIPLFEENSCVYLFTRSEFVKHKNRIGKSPLFFPMNSLEASDIDEESDFILAESIKRFFDSKKHFS